MYNVVYMYTYSNMYYNVSKKKLDSQIDFTRTFGLELGLSLYMQQAFYCVVKQINLD